MPRARQKGWGPYLNPGLPNSKIQAHGQCYGYMNLGFPCLRRPFSALTSLNGDIFPVRLLAQPAGAGRPDPSWGTQTSITAPRNRLTSTEGAAASVGCGRRCTAEFTPTLCHPRRLGRAPAHPQPSAQAPGPRHAAPSPAAALQPLGRRELQLRGGDCSCRTRAPDSARWVRGTTAGGHCCELGDCRPAFPTDRLRSCLGEGRGVGVVCCLRPAPPHAPDSAPERVVSVLSELQSVRAREGDGATFECTVSEIEITGSWKLGGRPLRPGGRVRIRQEGLADSIHSGSPLPRPRLTETPPH